MTMRLDLRNPTHRAFVTTRYEQHVLRFMTRTVRPGWWIVDGGAFIGYFTLLLARLAGPSGRVVAFEPVPAIAARLEENLALNELWNVRVERLALWKRSDTVELKLHRTQTEATDVDAASSLKRPVGEELLEVQATSLDEYVRIRGIERLDFLKLDVEYAEIEVLEGAEYTLRALRPILVLEVNEEPTRSVAEWMLRDMGYDLKVLGRTVYGVHLAAMPRR
jgi:FkbM family methyltransferase